MQLRRSLFTFLILFLTTYAPAQKAAPPGTVWLRDNVYIDLTPVCNVYYREYEYFLRDIIRFNLDSLESTVNTAPYYGLEFRKVFNKPHPVANGDSAALKIDREKKVSWQKWVDYKTYIQLPPYNYYPLLNVSYEIALQFCKWRTYMVQLMYSGKSSEKERSTVYKKVKYRLPTQEEWEYALKKFSAENTIKILSPKRKIPITELTERQTVFTLSNLSEMVQDRSVVKGCNWKQLNCLPGSNLTLRNAAPADWITFRCVCEVEE